MGISVLLVDDSRIARLGTRARLPAEVSDVREAGNGEEAIRLYQEQRPDLVVLDLTMPRMDGMEVLKLLRALDREAAVIVCTADTQVEARRRCMAAGAKEVLGKPVEKDALEAAIRKHLAGKFGAD